MNLLEKQLKIALLFTHHFIKLDESNVILVILRLAIVFVENHLGKKISYIVFVFSKRAKCKNVNVFYFYQRRRRTTFYLCNAKVLNRLCTFSFETILRSFLAPILSIDDQRDK